MGSPEDLDMVGIGDSPNALWVLVLLVPLVLCQSPHPHPELVLDISGVPMKPGGGREDLAVGVG